MRTLTHPPPEVVQGQRCSLVNIPRLWTLSFDVRKMLEFYTKTETETDREKQTDCHWSSREECVTQQLSWSCVILTTTLC